MRRKLEITPGFWLNRCRLDPVLPLDNCTAGLVPGGLQSTLARQCEEGENTLSLVLLNDPRPREDQAAYQPASAKQRQSCWNNVTRQRSQTKGKPNPKTGFIQCPQAEEFP